MMADKLLPVRDDKDFYRKAISYIYSFFLSLFLVIFSVCLVVRSGLFSDRYFFSVLDHGYYDIVYREIMTAAEDYTIPAEFDISVLDGVFTAEQLRRDIEGSAKASFSGKTFSPDLTGINAKLYANVENCIESGTVELDNESDKDTIINAYIDEIDKIYTGKLGITGIRFFTTARAGYRKYAVAGIAVIGLLSAFLIFMLLRLNRKSGSGLRYIAYAFGGFTIMAFAVPFYLYRSGFYSGIRISDESLYNFVSNYLRSILLSFINYSVIGLFATLLLIAAAILKDDPVSRTSVKLFFINLFRNNKGFSSPDQ